MAKFFGPIGYITTKETKPGKWTKVVTEKNYYGDLNRVAKRWENGQKINGDLRIVSEVSIVANPFLLGILSNIKYVKLYGTPWNVESIDVQHPRLILTLGGKYNGKVAGDEQDGA